MTCIFRSRLNSVTPLEPLTYSITLPTHTQHLIHHHSPIIYHVNLLTCHDTTLTMPPTVATTDLLIIGAGPAGLMAACWASQYPNMTTRIIDKRPGRTPTGHADGLQSRSLEILESFGMVDAILQKGVQHAEMCYWVFIAEC